MSMMQSIESINNLLDTGKGSKVSMLIENSMGAIILRHITLHQNTKVFLDDKANFHFDRQTPVLNLYYAQKNCRKVGGYRISKDTLLTLALGWQAIDGMESSKKSGTFTLENWECFDCDRYQSLSKQLTNVIYQQSGK